MPHRRGGRRYGIWPNPTTHHRTQQVGGVKSQHPCGEIRRINVEIPSLSVSDMRRLKATKYIGAHARGCWGFASSVSVSVLVLVWDGQACNATPAIDRLTDRFDQPH